MFSAREETIGWEKDCTVCKRRKAKNTQQVMASLPLHRLTTSMRAFTRIAVDYVDHLLPYRVEEEGEKIVTYVYLHVYHGLDANSFMNAFYRRGLPEEILSDNGKNFVAANKELQEMAEKMVKDTS